MTQSSKRATTRTSTLGDETCKTDFLDHVTNLDDKKCSSFSAKDITEIKLDEDIEDVGTSWQYTSNGFPIVSQLIILFLSKAFRCLISQCYRKLFILQYNPSQMHLVYMIHINTQG